jgi:predicted aminopeptidase
MMDPSCFSSSPVLTFVRGPRFRRLAGTFALTAVAATLVAANSAEGRFLLRAAREEARILLARRPIAELLPDPKTTPERRSQFELVVEARAFAAEHLGLQPGDTFTSFAEVGPGPLLHVLSASPKDRLAPYRWSYPIVGPTPYKGFFLREGALAEQRRLEQAGYDTYLRPANAFSTLGWLPDPLLSTTLDRDPVDLVTTVLHEIAHNSLWVPGSVPFNESYANFVGLRGAEAFFASRGDLESARRAEARWRDEKRLGALYGELEERLQELYDNGRDRPDFEARRARLFRQASGVLSGPLGRWMEVYSAERLGQRELNNATILAERIYRTGLGDFDRVYDAQKGDLRTTVKEIARRLRDAPRSKPYAALNGGAEPRLARLGLPPAI